eukprot:5510131-Pleurochrysis_carterae.AAC.2
MEVHESTINATARHNPERLPVSALGRQCERCGVQNAAVVQFGKLFCGKEAKSNLPPFRRVPWSDSRVHCARLTALWEASFDPASEHYKRLGAVLTRNIRSKGSSGKRAGGLLETFRAAINQR